MPSQTGIAGNVRDIDLADKAIELAALGIGIDVLTPEQERDLASWDMGT